MDHYVYSQRDVIVFVSLTIVLVFVVAMVIILSIVASRWRNVRDDMDGLTDNYKNVKQNTYPTHDYIYFDTISFCIKFGFLNVLVPNIILVCCPCPSLVSFRYSSICSNIFIQVTTVTMKKHRKGILTLILYGIWKVDGH
jgi:hypothetical protein